MSVLLLMRRMPAAYRALSLVPLALLFLQAPAQGQTLIKWVNPDPTKGNDSNTGTFRFPWRTLTHALAVARSSGVIGKVNIMYSQYPIAPQGFGDAGFDGQEPSDCFPITLIKNVVVSGVPDASGNMPVVKINEDPDGNGVANGEYQWPAWVNPDDPTPTTDPEPRNAYFYAATGATLANVIIDGTDYRHNKDHEPVGVRAKDVGNFTLLNASIVDLFDGVLFDEAGRDTNVDAVTFPGDVSTDTSITTSGSVTNCKISECFPSQDPDPAPTPGSLLDQDRGHSGVWLQVLAEGDDSSTRATVDVQISSGTIERCHDAIETRTLSSVRYTQIYLNMTGTNIQCNENGLEVVDPDSQPPDGCEINIEGCNFLSNFPRPLAEGGYQAEPTCAILQRTKDSDIKVRGSVFRNNAVAVRVGGAGLDMGKDDIDPDPGVVVPDPGLNVFIMDVDACGNPMIPKPCLPDDPQPAYYVMLLQMGTNEIYAYGNRWIPSNQGADSDGRMVTIPSSSCGSGVPAGSVCSPLCTPSTPPCQGIAGVNYDPVDFTNDPDFGPPVYGQLSTSVARNYSIRPGGGTIVFGGSAGIPACSSTSVPPCAAQAPTVTVPALPTCNWPSCP